jgi:hypothetical protein
VSSVFPISFLGPISYYNELVNSHHFEFEIQETYKKQSIRNRYKIGTSNGVLELTIPVIKPNGSKTLTKEILIDNSQNWKQNHWRAITSAYMHTPYFEHYESDIQKLIFSEEILLYKKCEECFRFINSTFDLGLQIDYTNEFILEKTELLNTDFQSNLKQNKSYIQPFTSKHGFLSNLSVLDLLFCEGPLGRFFFKES